MDNIDNLKEELRTYIISEFLPGEEPSAIQDDTPLRTSGIMDSMATLQLIKFVKERYHIKVEAFEAGVENFDSIDDIGRLIQKKGGHVS